MKGLPKALALLALAASGCSFMIVKPSAVKPLEASDCTDGYGWPVVDVLAGVAAAGATVYSATRSYEGRAPGSLEREDAVIGYGFITILYGGSAAAGFSRVHACRQARAAAPAPGALSLAR